MAWAMLLRGGPSPKSTSGSGKYFSIKVRLIRITFSIKIAIAMKNAKSKLDEKILIKVC